MKKNIKNATETVQPIAEVFVVTSEWADRHGDSGSSAKVFSTLEKAQDFMKADITDYLINYDAIIYLDDNRQKVACDTISEINGYSLTRSKSLNTVLKQAVKDQWLEINVDSSGTYSTWNLEKQKVL